MRHVARGGCTGKTELVAMVLPLMNVTSIVRFAAMCLLLGLGACGAGGGGDEGAATPPPLPPATGIGPAGGTVLGPNGEKVEIPPVALTTNIDTKVELSTAGFTGAGQMFAFTPHGTTFVIPVTMTLPFDPASVTGGTLVAVYKTNAKNQ